MVAAPAMTSARRDHAWLLAALLAAATLVALALVGPERSGSLGVVVAGGPMRRIAPDAVQRLRVQQGARVVVFERVQGRWQRDGSTVDDGGATSIEAALRLLHNTPPERRFDAPRSDFGLDAPSLTVEVAAADGTALVVVFGASNPIGLARYARVLHGPEAGIVLLPGDVHDSWLALLPSGAR
jgi:hypothetical protein